MDKACISRMVSLEMVKSLYKKTNVRFVPAASSNRHIHLCKQDIEKLFGVGYALEVFKPLSQPGQFAAKEKVDIVGPKGTIKGVRILGPARTKTQVEIFYADSYKLGVKPLIRMSGDLKGTPGIKLASDKGQTVLEDGVVVAARHIHMSPEQAVMLNLKNGNVVSVRKEGDRPLIFEDIPIRCGEGHSLELHLDMEEANAGLIKNGDLLEIISVK